MTEDKVTRINVGGHPTGIIGLQPILEDVANECKDRSDDDIKAELLNRLSQKNYISSRTRDMYGHAFLREYKKFVGEPFEDSEAGGLEIKVLGPGCSRCEKLEQDVLSVLTELNMTADVAHIRDIQEILSKIRILVDFIFY